MSDTVDARGLLCPLPVLRLRKALLAMPHGARVTLLATDAMAGVDVPHFCDTAGHRIVDQHPACDNATAFVVERGPDAPGARG